MTPASDPHPVRPSRKRLVTLLFALLVAFAGLWYVREGSRFQEEMATVPAGPEPRVVSPAPTSAPDPSSWAFAVARVEEARGSSERLDTPVELMHHQDRRRFLAVQMADSREESYELPHDQAELVEMIKSGQLVAVKALGADHLLYDVGTSLRRIR